MRGMSRVGWRICHLCNTDTDTGAQRMHRPEHRAGWICN
jgi:hypothetical protein